MAPRVDKTDSAIGVVRASLAANLADNVIDTVLGVSLDAQGRVVAGDAGQTDIVGIMIPAKHLAKAGQRVDIFKHADVVDIVGLQAGTHYWLSAAGALTATAAAGLVYAGYTVEADRLILSGFAGVKSAAGAN